MPDAVKDQLKAAEVAPEPPPPPPPPRAAKDESEKPRKPVKGSTKRPTGGKKMGGEGP